MSSSVGHELPPRSAWNESRGGAAKLQVAYSKQARELAVGSMVVRGVLGFGGAVRWGAVRETPVSREAFAKLRASSRRCRREVT